MNAAAETAKFAMDNPPAATAAANGWKKVCALEAIPQLGARVVKSAQGNIAVFRTASDEVFALLDKCPHKGGPLSQGIVHGRKVTCPLHNWNIQLEDGSAVAPDVGCARTFAVRREGGDVYLRFDAVVPLVDKDSGCPDAAAPAVGVEAQ